MQYLTAVVFSGSKRTGGLHFFQADTSTHVSRLFLSTYLMILLGVDEPVVSVGFVLLIEIAMAEILASAEL